MRVVPITAATTLTAAVALGFAAGPTLAQTVSTLSLTQPISVGGLLATPGGILATGTWQGTSIRLIDAATGAVTTALTGLNGPVDVAVDAAGRIYAGNWNSNTVSRGPLGGAATVWVAGGINPDGLLFDSEGVLWLTLGTRNKVKRIDPDGTITLIASGGILEYPLGIAQAEDGNFYIGGLLNGNVYRMAPTGDVSVIATVPGTGQYKLGHLEYASGTLFGTGLSDHVVYSISLDGEVSIIAGRLGVAGNADGPVGTSTLDSPNGISLSPDGQRLYVSNGLSPSGLLRVIDIGEVTEAPRPRPDRSTSPRLGAIAPNPFRSGTGIEFQTSAPGRVDLAVYDVQGRRLVALVDDARSAGIHRVAWDGTTASGRVAPGGVYFVRLVTDGGTETRRVVRMR